MLASLRRSASLGHTWALVALYFTSFGGFLALVVWLPSYFRALHQLDPMQAGILTAVGFALPSALSRIYGGALSDRFGGERVAMASFAATSLGAALTMLASGLAPTLCALLVMAVAMGIANAAVFKLVAHFIPDAVGAASGWVGGLGAFGGFAIPPLLGALVDVFGTAGYSRGFSVLLALALASTLLIYRRFGPREAAEPALPRDSLALDAS